MTDSNFRYTPNCEIKPGMALPEGVRRYALVLEYNGASFQGFQKQSTTINTVQTAVESALTSIAAEPVTLVCAGRTDAGVHATRQVIHFDTRAIRPERAWVAGTNTRLPATVRIRRCNATGANFHARFSAQARTYRYLTLMDDVPSAYLHGLVTWMRAELDVDAMQLAAQHLLGEHDFSSFRSSQCQARSPVRHLHALRLYRSGVFLVTEVKANAFLHHMVRNIMGALFEVGRGVKPSEWVGAVLAAKDRTCNAATAPAHGLYLVGVDYPSQFGLQSQAAGPQFIDPAVTAC